MKATPQVEPTTPWRRSKRPVAVVRRYAGFIVAVVVAVVVLNYAPTGHAANVSKPGVSKSSVSVTTTTRPR